ncbi:aminotransferase class IV [Flavihumibacter profundi]|uniref:aminotransferase class IV n=1 Tax=Flavihumibacter profundi TaxID=2716883 RepID=UPI001CC4F16F|nr:aminotransferase class IV [Flavihumibacter profundi]MBZ5855913.1 aminotransferase class IV [Flavihumibacter profundi]
MKAGFCWINGELHTMADASLQLNDLSIQRGYGIFDFFKVVGGEPVFLEAHLNRLQSSAEKMRLAAGYSRKTLVEQITVLLAKNQMPQSGIRITITGGYSHDGYALATPNCIITQHPLQLSRVLPPGIRLVTYPFQRQLPEVKTIDYLMAIWLQPFIKENNADDVLYESGHIVTECPRANFFIVNDSGEIQTTRHQVLAGVTRNKILALAAKGFKIAEKDIWPDDIYSAKEAFITSTSRHVTPVLSVNGRTIANGQPGEITNLLSEALLQEVFR